MKTLVVRKVQIFWKWFHLKLQTFDADDEKLCLIQLFLIPNIQLVDQDRRSRIAVIVCCADTICHAVFHPVPLGRVSGDSLSMSVSQPKQTGTSLEEKAKKSVLPFLQKQQYSVRNPRALQFVSVS